MRIREHPAKITDAGIAYVVWICAEERLDRTWAGWLEFHPTAPEATRAHELDPLSPIIAFSQAGSYAYARQFDRATELCKKVIAENPAFGRAHTGLASVYWAQHMYPQAIQEFKIGSQLEGDKNYREWAEALDAGFRSAGWPGALRKAIAVSLAQRQTKSGYVSPYQIAGLYADLGEKEHAFQWLNTAYQEHDASLSNLPTDFLFDSVRSDPRYAELTHKIGGPAIIPSSEEPKSLNALEGI